MAVGRGNVAAGVPFRSCLILANGSHYRLQAWRLQLRTLRNIILNLAGFLCVLRLSPPRSSPLRFSLLGAGHDMGGTETPPSARRHASPLRRRPPAAPDRAADGLSGVEVVGRTNPQKSALGRLHHRQHDDPGHASIAINVVPQELIQQQHITTLEQALRDVPGITVAIGGGRHAGGRSVQDPGPGRQQLTSTPTACATSASTSATPSTIEEVQILKGPSGAMFGRGTSGGAINTDIQAAERRARDYLVTEATIGNGDYYRLTADANKRINDTTAIRLNVFGNSTGVVDRDRGGHSDRGRLRRHRRASGSARTRPSRSTCCTRATTASQTTAS